MSRSPALIFTIGLILLLAATRAGVAAASCSASTQPADTALLRAALAQNFAGVIDSLDAGADVNARDAKCNTPLIWAARSNSPNIVVELFAHDVAFAAVNEDGKSAMDFAVAVGGELSGLMQKAINDFEADMVAKIQSDMLSSVVEEYDRRSLNPDLPIDGKNSAIVVAASATGLSEARLNAFVDAMLARKATADWDEVAGAAIDGRHILLLRRALQQVPAKAFMASDIKQDDGGKFLAAVVSELVQSPVREGSLAEWLDLALRIADPQLKLAALSLLVKEGDKIGDVDSMPENLVDEFGSGGDHVGLKFLLTHGATLEKGSKILNYLLGPSGIPGPIDAELIELALDAGARADVPEQDFGERPDLVGQLFDDIYAERSATTQFDAEQLGRIIAKMLVVGGGIDVPNFNERPTLVTEVLSAPTHPELRRPLLDILSDQNAKPPSVCDMVGHYPVADILLAVGFKAFAPDEWGAFACAAKVGREISGTLDDRHSLIAALVAKGVTRRDVALAAEIDRFANGGGDSPTLDILLDPSLATSAVVMDAIDALKASVTTISTNQQELDHLLASGLTGH